MCGIAGIRKFGKTPINATEIRTLLLALEHRGMHATGIALMTGGEIHICKNGVPAWDFVVDKTTTDFLDTFLTDETTIALLHTRAATLGNPEKNENNHPFFRGHTAIVHNGMISNHLSLFAGEKVERTAETDSDIIRALLDKGGISSEGIDLLGKMSGSAAIAAMTQDHPELLLLARSGSPLAYATSRDKLWWASEMGAIQKAVRPWNNTFGLPARATRTDISYYTMPDNTAYILGPFNAEKTRLVRKEFKSCGNYVQPNYSAMHESYGRKTQNWKEESRRERRMRALPAAATIQATTPPGFGMTHKIAPCPKCGQLWSIPKAEHFRDYHCKDKDKCGVSLAACDSIPDEKLKWSNNVS